MLHQVGVSFDLYYDARKHKIKMYFHLLEFACREFTVYDKLRCLFSRTVRDYVCYTAVFWLLMSVVTRLKTEADSFRTL